MLTAKRFNTLRAVAELWKRGYGPSHREIAEYQGLSLRAVQCRLDGLADEGYIVREWALQRATRLTRLGRAVLKAKQLSKDT